MHRLALALVFTAACTQTVQTTSGLAYLADRGPVSDSAIAQAAAGEPTLSFPAKIGIARVIGHYITAPTQAELALLTQIRPTPDPLGEFIPVSPLLAQTLTFEHGETTIRKVQLTAARQHLDYVLIYVLSREGNGFNATGRAGILMMDVRSGYVYATASTAANVAGLGSIRRGWGDRILSDAAAAKLVQTALPDIDAIFQNLSARAASS